jgi:hypothetical protein
VLWYFFGPERVEWTRFGDVGGTTRPMPALLEKYQRLRGRKFGPGAWKDPAPGLAIDFLPVGYDASRVFFFVIKTKKIESWETEWAVQRWKNENGASVSGWKAVADERNPETIDSAFAEDFYVLKRQSEYFFVTQSGKLFVAPPRKKGEKSRAMKALWDDAKRPIVAVIEDADRGKVWLFAKDKTAGAKRDLFFEMNDTIKTESFDPAKLTPVNVEGRAKLLLEYQPLLPHANKK